MSDTPRTDAEPTYKTGIARTRTVNIAFARALERELAEAQAEIVRLKGEAESWEKVFDRTCELLAETKTALAEPEQEPVGKFSKFSDGVWKEVTASSAGIFLYTAPPRREWVGLTEDEVNLIYAEPQTHVGQYAKAIEAKLREKNG